MSRQYALCIAWLQVGLCVIGVSFPAIGFASLFLATLCLIGDDSYLNGLSLGLTLLSLCVAGPIGTVATVAGVCVSVYQALDVTLN